MSKIYFILLFFIDAISKIFLCLSYFTVDIYLKLNARKLTRIKFKRCLLHKHSRLKINNLRYHRIE